MATSSQVRAYLNAVSKKKYKKSYASLTDREASLVRKYAVKRAFKKRR